MKKSFIALLLLAISSTLMAAEYSKLDIKRAEFFANEAQKEFNLSKKATQQFQQLKLENIVAYRKQVASLKKAGKEDEAKAAAKALNKDYLPQCTEVLGCSNKEFWAFTNKTTPGMWKIKAK